MGSTPFLRLLTGFFMYNLPLLRYIGIGLHIAALPATLQLIQLKTQHRKTHTELRLLAGQHRHTHVHALLVPT